MKYHESRNQPPFLGISDCFDNAVFGNRCGLTEPDFADIETNGRQAAKNKATQNRIIEACIAITNERGFAAASSARIAQEAGVTWGALQHHFGNKDSILREVLRRSHLKFQEALGEDQFTRGTPEQRVHAYVDAAWHHYQGPEFKAAMEILLATRSHGESPKDLTIFNSRSEHLQLGRKIFHDSPATSKTLGETIYVVHRMLSGMLVEPALEPRVFSPECI